MERRGGEAEWLFLLEDLLAYKDDAVDLKSTPEEEHKYFAPANLSSSMETHLPSSFKNHPSCLPQPEINPFYPANHQNTYSLSRNHSPPNTLHDHPNLEDYFCLLNLDPSAQRPSFRSSGGMDFPSPRIEDDGFLLDHQNIIQENFLDYLLNGGRNCNSAMNRYPSRIMPHRDQNSAQSANFNSNFGRFSIGSGRASSNYSGYSSSPSSLIDDMLEFFPLEDLRGHIYMLANDRDGSKFLLEKIKEGKPKDIEMIFLEVRYCVSQLMVDRFGSEFIQKFFEVCDQQQINQMLLLVLRDENLMAVCCDLHGTRAMQKLVKQISTREQRRLVVSALLPIAESLTKNQYGCHVIQDCAKSFPSEDIRHIFHVVAENCVGIGLDKYGCRVLQKCLDYARGEAKEHLMAEIAANALVLSESEFGNYVVQYILAMGIPHVTAVVLERLAGSYVSLSMNKYGSNVVESCIKLLEEDQVEQIISEMIIDPNFLGVLRDPFGNYVAQSALEKAKGRLRHAMVNIIQMHYLILQSHPYGKRVLALTRSRATNRCCCRSC